VSYVRQNFVHNLPRKVTSFKQIIKTDQLIWKSLFMLARKRKSLSVATSHLCVRLDMHFNEYISYMYLRTVILDELTALQITSGLSILIRFWISWSPEAEGVCCSIILVIATIFWTRKICIKPHGQWFMLFYGDRISKIVLIWHYHCMV